MDKRSVYIDSTDAKARQISASYMIPTPVWKSSYRLIFDKTAQPTLEGWAIVDNTVGRLGGIDYLVNLACSYVDEGAESLLARRPAASLCSQLLDLDSPLGQLGHVVPEGHGLIGGMHALLGHPPIHLHLASDGKGITGGPHHRADPVLGIVIIDQPEGNPPGLAAAPDASQPPGTASSR